MFKFEQIIGNDKEGFRSIALSIDSDHLNIHEIMAEFRSFLLAVGYHPETIAQYIGEE